MWRVIKPGGRVVVADWDSLENSPGDLAFANLLERLFGENVANELKATYALGDEQKLLSLFENTGIHHPQITTTEQTTCYPSVESWM